MYIPMNKDNLKEGLGQSLDVSGWLKFGENMRRIRSASSLRTIGHRQAPGEQPASTG